MKLRKTIGQNVLLLRKERDYSQEELAKLLKANKQTIWRIESASTNIGVDTIEDLCKALKVEAHDLVTPRKALPLVIDHSESFEIAMVMINDGIKMLRLYRSKLK